MTHLTSVKKKAKPGEGILTTNLLPLPLIAIR
jgi:hypothetical protein